MPFRSIYQIKIFKMLFNTLMKFHFTLMYPDLLSKKPHSNCTHEKFRRIQSICKVHLLHSYPLVRSSSGWGFNDTTNGRTEIQHMIQRRIYTTQGVYKKHYFRYFLFPGINAAKLLHSLSRAFALCLWPQFSASTHQVENSQIFAEFDAKRRRY